MTFTYDGHSTISYDGHSMISAGYAVKSYPNLYVIDQQGVSAAVHVGFDDDSLKEIIADVNRLLATGVATGVATGEATGVAAGASPQPNAATALPVTGTQAAPASPPVATAPPTAVAPST